MPSSISGDLEKYWLLEMPVVSAVDYVTAMYYSDDLWALACSWLDRTSL